MFWGEAKVLSTHPYQYKLNAQIGGFPDEKEVAFPIRDFGPDNRHGPGLTLFGRDQGQS
jgi:hypothetical protein